MRSVQELLEFCKNQAAYHARVSGDPKLKPHQAKKHGNAADGLMHVVSFLESLPSDLASSHPGPNGSDIFQLDPFRLDDIPEDLVAELKISRAEKADAQILELFRLAGRPLNISEVLIGLYRKFNESQKRTAVSARLYRLYQEGHLDDVAGERGVYRLSEQKEVNGKTKPAD